MLIIQVVGCNNLVGKYLFWRSTSVGGSSSVLSVRIVCCHRWVVAVVATAIRWLRWRWWWFSRIVTSVVRVRWSSCYVSVARFVTVSGFDEYGRVRVGIVVVVVYVIVVRGWCGRRRPVVATSKSLVLRF